MSMEITEFEMKILQFMQSNFSKTVYITSKRLAHYLGEETYQALQDMHAKGLVDKMEGYERYKVSLFKAREKKIEIPPLPFLLGECMKSIVGKVDYEALQ